MRSRPLLSSLGLLAVLVLTALAACLLAAASLSSFVGYAPPVSGLPPRPTAGALSERVVLVVVDGLRYDASLKMPYLNELRGRGAELISEATPPSVSLPGYAALLTGASPEASGVTTNWHVGPALVDSLLAGARRAGLRTGVAGNAGWGSLFAGQVDVARLTRPAGSPPAADQPIALAADPRDLAENARADAEVMRAGLALLRGEAGPSPRLLVVHLLGVDEAGHAYGGRSDQYDRAAASADELLREAVGALDLARDTLVVTADHGHLDRGGHGGDEPEAIRTPLVLVGKGIVRPRSAGRAPAVVPQVDVAPTLAILLGVGLPAEGEGRPIFECLALDAAARAERGVETLIARRDRALAYATALGVAPPPPDVDLAARNALAGRFYAQAAADADDGLTRLDDWAASVREERLNSDRLTRLPISALALIAPIAAALLLRPRRETLLALPFGVLYVGGYWLAYLWRGYGVSLSALDGAGSAERFVVEGTSASALLALALVAVAGILHHSRGHEEVIRLVARFLFVASALVVWQVALFVVLYGATYRLYLPDPTFALVYFVNLLQLQGLGIASLVTAGLAAILDRWPASSRGRAP